MSKVKIPRCFVYRQYRDGNFRLATGPHVAWDDMNASCERIQHRGAAFSVEAIPVGPPPPVLDFFQSAFYRENKDQFKEMRRSAQRKGSDAKPS